jgi:hypothetical protein
MVSLNPKRLQKFPAFSERNRMQWRRKLLLFSFFLVVSVLIWTLNALSKNYTTEIKYPISYTNFPEQKVQINKLPESLGLKVNAHGYALLRYRLTNRPVPINFRVSSYTMNRFSGDSSKFFLLTRYAREQIARQLPSELELIELSPDSLIFQFATEVKKLVPVVPAVQFILGKEFTLVGDIQLMPDSVLVTGPDIYLDTLSKLTTESRELGLIEKSYSEKLSIVRYPGFRFEYDEVECNIALEKLTELKMYVPIQIVGLPDSMRMQTFPPRINVSGIVGLSNYDRVSEESFFAEVDYIEVLENKTRIQVNLKQYPDYLLNLDFYPQTVEYLLSVK